MESCRVGGVHSYWALLGLGIKDGGSNGVGNSEVPLLTVRK